MPQQELIEEPSKIIKPTVPEVANTLKPKKQHDLLMDEFRKAHNKMFPTGIETPDEANETKNTDPESNVSIILRYQWRSSCFSILDTAPASTNEAYKSTQQTQSSTSAKKNLQRNTAMS